MIAKGSRLSPRVTLVGVSFGGRGDSAWPTSCASERTFQLLTHGGWTRRPRQRSQRAVIQTLYPEHYSVNWRAEQDYPASLRARAEIPEGDAISAASWRSSAAIVRARFQARSTTPADLVERTQAPSARFRRDSAVLGAGAAGKAAAVNIAHSF